jgi:hypothetical protein
MALAAALIAAGPGARLAHAMQMATGTYTGDGAASRPITGAGFRPDLVVVKGNAAQVAVMRTASMSGDASKELAGGTALQPKRIVSLDADGFTVGTHAEVNGKGIGYSWVAFRNDGAGDFRVASYVGSGADNRAIGGLGFEPAYLVVMSAGPQKAVQRSAAMVGDASIEFDKGGLTKNLIQSLAADGFQVGSDARANKSGTTYHYAAWKAAAGGLSVGAYAGNGLDNRSIPGAGFRPDYVILKSTTNEAGLHRPVALAGDATLSFGATANAANAIQKLEPDGFQVGTSPAANGQKATYYWTAFHGNPTATLAIAGVNGGAHPAAGSGFSVVVQSRDGAGAPRNVTTATSVQLGLKSGSGTLGGALSGTIPAGASEVVISGTTYTRAESGVVLTATRTSGDDLAPGDSGAFVVDPGPIATYAVTLSSPQAAGTSFVVTVTAQDAFNNRVTTDSTSQVSLESASGHVQFDANLDGSFGDATKTLTGGLASMNARGTTAEATAIVATDGSGKAGSATLTIVAGAAKTLAFTIQPGSAVVGGPIGGPPTIAVQDGFGNTVTSSRASISVAIGTNPGAGTLGGTTTQAAAAGIAGFANLTISEPGAGYTLGATSSGLTGAPSGAFTISAATGAISGRVTRAGDGAAVAGAAVSALQSGLVKGSTTADADGTYTLASLTPGVYDVSVSATGFQQVTQAGVAVTAGGMVMVDASLAPIGGPAIRITSPTPGSALSDLVVLVQGDVQAPAGAPAGVAVNGMAGIVENGRFAALVPVDASVTSLTATLSDVSSMLAADSIGVTVPAPPPEPQVLLIAIPPGGVPPLTVTFRLSSQVAVRQVALDADGDGVIDVRQPTIDGVSVTFQQPGVYVPRAQVTDAQGQTYEATTLVHVLTPAALDAQLQAVWASFKDAIRAGDLARAASFLHSSTRDAYRAQLAAMSPAARADIDRIMTTIQLVQIGFGGAQYEMLRPGSDQPLSFAVWFQIDEDGVWRLRRF